VLTLANKEHTESREVSYRLIFELVQFPESCSVVLDCLLIYETKHRILNDWIIIYLLRKKANMKLFVKPYQFPTFY
jgi:mRNA-degrading endonuclease YafQ of YafQ-DinJ toxin-antitoxin module